MTTTPASRRKSRKASEDIDVLRCQLSNATDKQLLLLNKLIDAEARVEELEAKLLDRKQDPVIIGASRVGRIARCKACNGTGRRPIGGRGQIFGLTNRCFECQPMTEEECQ